MKNVVSFRYIFASEEYLSFVGGIYNDVFGLFITRGNTTQNIAVLPNNKGVVSINNVNAGRVDYSFHNFCGVII